MLTAKQRIQAVEGTLKINDTNTDALQALSSIESDLLTYQRLGAPVWMKQDAESEIARIRAWIADEARNTVIATSAWPKNWPTRSPPPRTLSRL